MIADINFTNLPLDFWANVRFISQESGYTRRKAEGIKAHTIGEIMSVYTKHGFDTDKIIKGNKEPNEFGHLLVSYFARRAEMLQEHAEKNLMNTQQAKNLFDELTDLHKPTWPVTLNKQKGDKKGPNYFTGIINILIEIASQGYPIDYNPRKLTVLTENLSPARTLSRRVDGGFPSVVNPIAIWEIKEYYHTTTFGSKISDGVYETQLDGSEFKEARESLNIDVYHYLMIDAYYTWWGMGRSYLCRICDMLHMGITSEVLFGREVVERIPLLVPAWIEKLNERTICDI